LIQQAIAKLIDRQSLTVQEAEDAMKSILQGQATPSQIAGFLTALRMKGETPEEIAGCAAGMRAAATRIAPAAPVVVDTCGTGGDRQGAFNISTLAALIVAGAGFVVAKHGNRSVSSQCGSADVLEALGVKIDAVPAVVEKCLSEVGIGFLFAPNFHPAMRHAMPTRKELGVRTVFNILGPLCNPAGANAQVIGAYSPKLLEVLGRVLLQLGAKHAMVVHSANHDEITLSGVTRVVEVNNGRLTTRKLTPASFGFRNQPKGALRGGDKHENAEIFRRILQGEKNSQRDVAVANAAAAILVASRASRRSDVKTIRDARGLAEQSLDSGNAWNKLQKLIECSRSAVGDAK
jgi:anthranilate phosphoribosyltransferase